MATIQINPTQEKKININVNSIDGTYPNYTAVHDATAGTSIADVDAANNIYIYYTAAFGFAFWQISRSFADFDFSCDSSNWISHPASSSERTVIVLNVNVAQAVNVNVATVK